MEGKCLSFREESNYSRLMAHKLSAKKRKLRNFGDIGERIVMSYF
jgi:hypothetical protein